MMWGGKISINFRNYSA